MLRDPGAEVRSSKPKPTFNRPELVHLELAPVTLAIAVPIAEPRLANAHSTLPRPVRLSAPDAPESPTYSSVETSEEPPPEMLATPVEPLLKPMRVLSAMISPLLVMLSVPPP